MDNVGKALIIAGSVLMFVVAISTAVYLYSGLMKYIGDISYVADIDNKAEQALLTDIYATVKTVGKAEIIMSLININDFAVDEIKIVEKSVSGNNDVTTTYIKEDDYTFRRKSNGSIGNTYDILKYDYDNDRAILDDVEYTVSTSIDGSDRNIITYTYTNYN